MELDWEWLLSLWGPLHNEIVGSLVQNYEELQDDEGSAFN